MSAPVATPAPEAPREPLQRMLALVVPSAPEPAKATGPLVPETPEEPESPPSESDTPAEVPVPDESAAPPDVAPEPEPPPEAQLETVVVDGEELRISKDELRAGYSRRADYTRKTQKLAEDRKQMEAELAQAREAREQYSQRLELAENMLRAQLGEEPDWNKLRSQLGDAEFAAAVAEHNLKEKRLAALQAEQQRVAGQRQAEWEKVQRERLTAEQAKLLEVVPEWRDHAKAEAERAALVEYGRRVFHFTDADLQGINDHRAIVLLRKAKAYDDLMAAKPKLVPNAPAVAKPGAKTTVAKPDSLAVAREQLRTTHSTRDAEDLLFRAIQAGKL